MVIHLGVDYVLSEPTYTGRLDVAHQLHDEQELVTG